MSSDGGNGGVLTRVASVLIFAVLLLTLVVSIAPNVNTVVVEAAEVAWPGYASELRGDPQEPECSLEELDAKLATCPAAGEEGAEAPTDGDPFGGEDPFGGGAAPDDAPTDDDPFAGQDPFGGGGDAPAPAPAPPAAPAPAPDADDPFAGQDPFGGGGDAPAADGDDPFAGQDPFAAGATDEKVNCPAVRNLRERCAVRHADYDSKIGRITSSVRSFRKFEGLISEVARFPWWKQLLVVLVGLGAFVTTLHREHIGLREPRNLLEHRIRQGAELAAALMLFASQVADWQVQSGSSAEVENGSLPFFWGAVFLALAGLNLFHLARPPKLDGEPTTFSRAVMVVPLFAYMVLISGLYFLIAEGHPSGQAIYLHKFVQIPNIYLGIGLYIWGGMLLRRTRIAPLVFRVAEPLNLPPAILAWVVVVFAAFPTAYSGASGIFVIAAGAVVFERLRAAGASKRLAVAATAMSGSLGVVLRPCLVVVLISILNKQVTTAELFGWGLYVFVLTAVLALLAFLWMNDKGFHMSPFRDAVGPMSQAILRVLPFVGIAIGTVLAFGYVLGTWLNEHTAPFVVPVAMLALITFDKVRKIPADEAEPPPNDPSRAPLWPSLIGATEESSHHVGALLMLMACSVGLGGMVERSDVMYALVPEQFGSTFLAMSFLVVVMVLVGMTMDALGAVILVSFTVAKIAYDNGIDPVHFWMMVLVAFELGYLTPPVSLNHLLARQVIGPDSHVEDDPVPGGGFYANYEHIIMPMVVMGVALLLVAYIPLFFY